MKKITFLVLFAGLTACGQGFSLTPSNWGNPPGGQVYNGAIGFFKTSDDDLTFENENSQMWSTFDINGDGKPDIVVTSQIQSGRGTVFNNNTNNPYWKVYLNTGSAFSTTAINWSLPVGGLLSSGINFGYYNTVGESISNDEGHQIWSTMDMNGDNKPDLVVTSQAQSGVIRVFGNVNSNPYWKVYLNTGSGFSATAINWPLPVGGNISSGIFSGYYHAADGNVSLEDEGSQLWNTMDINGDNKPDLVVTAQMVSGYGRVFGTIGSSTFWKVYLNTGSGFSTTVTNWTLPTGGQIASSTAYGYNKISDFDIAFEDEGTQIWNTMDINGDSKPDLLVTGQLQSGNATVFGTVGANPYWKVYLNTGIGFSATSTSWALPAGGQIYQNVAFSFNKTIDFDLLYENEGSQMWDTMDINGDHMPDLLVTAQMQSGIGRAFGNVGISNYWKVYINSGSGFGTTATNWQLPIGGNIYNGNPYGYNKTSDFDLLFEDESSQMWSCFDINGDSKPELVVTSEIQSGQTKVFGTVGSNPYWKVFSNNAPLATPGFESSPQIVVYPNPATDFIHIESSQPFNEAQIFDLTGKKVMQTDPAANEIDIRSLSKGIYLLQLIVNDEKLIYKLIKQ